MLYKKTLTRLHEDAGINYNNIDDVKKALIICNDIKQNYENQLNSTMCYHNGILCHLLDIGIINEAEYNLFYDKPSYIETLIDIDHLLFRKSEDVNYSEKIDIINSFRKTVHNLEDYITDNGNLEDIAKNARDNMYDELKNAIKRNKKEGKALTYQLRKLLRRK